MTIKNAKFFYFRLLFCILILSFCILSAISAYAQTDSERISELQKEIEKLEQQADQYRQNIAKEQANAESLKREMSILMNQINNLKTQISITVKKINSASLEINNVAENIDTTQNRISYQKNAMGELLLDLYRQDRESLVVAVMKNDVLINLLALVLLVPKEKLR